MEDGDAKTENCGLDRRFVDDLAKLGEDGPGADHRVSIRVQSSTDHGPYTA